MHSIRDLLSLAFARVGLPWQPYVEIDPRYQRPSEVDQLLGDASKAADLLGWGASTSFEQLIAMMVDADQELAGQERWMRERPAAAAPVEKCRPAVLAFFNFAKCEARLAKRRFHRRFAIASVAMDAAC
jgi:GDP-mannose 4,6 dehydratase